MINKGIYFFSLYNVCKGENIMKKIITKTCCKCGREKAIGDYNNNCTTKDKLQDACRACIKKYHMTNIKKIRIYQKAWHKQNPRYIGAYNKRWKLKHPNYNKDYYLKRKIGLLVKDNYRLDFPKKSRSILIRKQQK